MMSLRTAAVCAGLLLSGCSSSTGATLAPAGRGPAIEPLDLGSTISVCIPVGGDRPTTSEVANRHFIFEQFIAVVGDRPITLTSIEFATEAGLDVGSVRLLKDPPPTSIGWAPFTSGGKLWAKTIPAVGAELLPHSESFLEVEVAYLGPADAHLADMTVTYQTDATQGRAEWSMELLMSATSDGCIRESPASTPSPGRS